MGEFTGRPSDKAVDLSQIGKQKEEKIEEATDKNSKRWVTERKRIARALPSIQIQLEKFTNRVESGEISKKDVSKLEEIGDAIMDIVAKI